MDNQAYLDQIAASNRPEKASKFSSIIKSNIFKLLAAAVGIFVIVFIIGQILSGVQGNTKQTLFNFKVRLDNVIGAIDEYQGSIKSSRLRSYSASLSTIASSTQQSVEEYANKTYSKPKITGSDEVNKAGEELKNDLFNAKINGLLDRVYARKLSYEISIIMTEESKLIKAVKDNDFKKALQNSQDSLSVIKDSFTSFSETK